MVCHIEYRSLQSFPDGSIWTLYDSKCNVHQTPVLQEKAILTKLVAVNICRTEVLMRVVVTRHSAVKCKHVGLCVWARYTVEYTRIIQRLLA